MTIANDDLAKLCRLAKIAFADAERTAAVADLDKMIAMIDALQAVDTEGIEPLAHPFDAAQRLRPDEVTDDIDRDHLQAAAPALQDGLFLVPRVLE